MNIKEIQEEIVSEFAMFGDWMEKYDYLIDLGKTLPAIKEEHKTDQNIINGCQSQVWLYAEMENDQVVYTADSDAIITKGIIGLLIRALSHHTPDEILEADMDFINEIGLKEHLSPTRANGLVAMIKQMKNYALAYKIKTQK